jgi:hypothetical protein
MHLEYSFARISRLTSKAIAMKAVVLLFTALSLLLGCKQASQSDPSHGHNSDVVPAKQSVPTSSSAAPISDQWVGKWIGPEGTYLQLDGVNGAYKITLKDLDTERYYTGAAIDNRIVFTRNDVEESIRATNGVETGMKWLADKANCLTIRSGEGFCRD